MGAPIKSEIARSLISRFPNTPSKTLGKMLHREHPKMFLTDEKGRDIVRLVRGKRGKLKKGNFHIKDKSLFESEERPKNPFNLPASYERKPDPYKIKYEKVGIISDLHIPYFSMEAITACLTWLKNKGPDCILINGDLLDFYMASRFQPDPRMRNIAQELADTNQFLDVLKREFPKTKIIYKLGNHCVRLEKYLVVNAPILLDVPEFQLKNLLHLAERQIDFVDDLRLMHLGKLTVAHGHEMRNGLSQPVNIARGVFLRATDCVLVGHSHRTSEHTSNTIRGKVIGTWSTGALCELSPAYNVVNNWNHGFAYVEHEMSTGNFHVQNLKIIKGKVF